MSRFVIRRLLGAVPLLIGVAALSFLFMQLAPGSPDDLYARNTRMSQAQLDHIRHNMGLDRPAYIQFLLWMKNLAKGDLGLQRAGFFSDTIGLGGIQAAFEQLEDRASDQVKIVVE